MFNPLLFDIYLNNLLNFAESTNVYNFSGYTIFPAGDKNFNCFINKLEYISYLTIDWFKKNDIKPG